VVDVLILKIREIASRSLINQTYHPRIEPL
ncbi:MAG: hypothetical protein ACI8RD_001769, partial [Bacillariaceae sp.]|jgi:hypothetical protein